MNNQIPPITTFNKTMKMADLLHINYHFLTVLSRFNIKLGFGDKSIEKVCAEKKINIDFFLFIINVFHNPNYIHTHADEVSFDVELLVNYIEKTHNYYNNLITPTLKLLIKDVSKICKEETRSVLLMRFFNQYIKELTEHIQYEEDVVFPYLRLLNMAIKEGVDKSELEDIDFRIDHFQDKHHSIQEKLFDLKNVLIKYFSLPDDETVIHILFLLYRFEKDLADHILLENHLLVPMVRKMEQKLFQ
ncbi:MAG: hemerythrin domain-containing protein [Bacteroidales bacterium]|nr:hemerythrin domain-containing protein [Bacteroidales bacterium]